MRENRTPSMSDPLIAQPGLLTGGQTENSQLSKLEYGKLQALLCPQMVTQWHAWLPLK